VPFNYGAIVGRPEVSCEGTGTVCGEDVQQLTSQFASSAKFASV